MEDYYENDLDYNLNVNYRSDGEDYEDLNAGDCDEIYENYASKENLTPFEHYDCIESLENDYIGNEIEKHNQEVINGLKNDNYYAIEDECENKNLICYDTNDNNDGDGLTLREVVEARRNIESTIDHRNKIRRRRIIHIGAAVLPLPLFGPGYDDNHNGYKSNNNDRNRERKEDTNNHDLRYASLLANEFNAVVIEHHLKWSSLSHDLPGPLTIQNKKDNNNNNNNNTPPKPQQSRENEHSHIPSTRLGRYDFHHSDLIVDWALSNKMIVKGHVLIWHVTTPTALLEPLSNEDFAIQVKRHIYTTIGHYRHRIHRWDVVNEALAPDGSLADTIFLRKMGKNYIETCFRWAYDAIGGNNHNSSSSNDIIPDENDNDNDNPITLIYNDNKVESSNTKKGRAFYQLLRHLKIERNVPIHSAGMQCHFDASGSTVRKQIPSPMDVKEQVKRLGELGLTVNLSEMDVRVGKVQYNDNIEKKDFDENDNNKGNDVIINDNSDIENEKEDKTNKLTVNLRTMAQRQIYRDIVYAALSEDCCDGVWLWGLTDVHTWVHDYYGTNESPMIFDKDYCRKDAYYGLREALEGKEKGKCSSGRLKENGDGNEDVNEDESIPWGHPWMSKEIVDDDGGDSRERRGDARPDWLQ